MQNTTALYCATIATPDDAITNAAQAAATKDIHLAILLYSELPTLPLNAYGAMPYGSFATPDTWPETLRAAQDALRARVDSVEKLVAETGVSADIRPILVAHGDLKNAVALSARTSDIAYFAPDLRQDDIAFREILHSVLFHSPIAGIINGTVAQESNRVMVAWDSSFASARAAHLALPYLKSADNVHIVCFDATTAEGQIEPGREAATWLSHHGCDVTLTQLPSGGQEIGACILDHAAEIGADLIVAGAYGHSRLQQAIFGGTSRSLIEQTNLPVLMSH